MSEPFSMSNNFRDVEDFYDALASCFSARDTLECFDLWDEDHAESDDPADRPPVAWWNR